MTIEEFCDRHDACDDGRKWALANCRDMDHAWETMRPDWLIWVATRPGVLDARTLRLFSVWSARNVQHLMTDPRSIAALDIAERYANGQATDAELAAARDAVSADIRAAEDAAWVKRSAAWAAEDAAQDAAWYAASSAALAATWDSTRAAARAAERAAARAAERAAQAAWLRSNAKPRFEGGAR